MDYLEKMNRVLKRNMTDTGYSFWSAVVQKIPDIWNRPTSSTLKHHKKDDGRVPSVAEHTYEMLYACIKIWRLFDAKPRTELGDVLLLSIALHDAFKYGEKPHTREHTTVKHDKICADMIDRGKNTFLKFLNESSVDVLEESVRFHSGRWSTDADENFDFDKHHPFVLFIHMLDMFSANNLIHIPEESR